MTRGIPVWIVNGTAVTLAQIDDPGNNPNVPPGHSRIGSDIIIEAPPANNTMYFCEVALSHSEFYHSDTAFVYVAG